MAARNSSRGARRRGRLGGNRPLTHPLRSAAKEPSATEVLTREIRLLALRLEVIYRTAVTVEMALRCYCDCRAIGDTSSNWRLSPASRDRRLGIVFSSPHPSPHFRGGADHGTANQPSKIPVASTGRCARTPPRLI